MRPQIDFSHVLQELSVNRNDPCEIIRELISNAYDAKASHIYYAPTQDNGGFLFLDTGSGLSHEQAPTGISPWEAFFSIGKSTKRKGEVIGYKCQGSKLCFACARIFVASKADVASNVWSTLVIENPRWTLNINFDLTPTKTADVAPALAAFYSGCSASTQAAVDAISVLINSEDVPTATLIAIQHLDAEDFTKHFGFGEREDESYIYNYIRFYTVQGDTRRITKAQGFGNAQIAQIVTRAHEAKIHIFNGSKFKTVPFGFPYLVLPKADPSIKSPSQISRLRDGRFFCRAAKSFNVGQARFSIVLAVDGNRRAHDEYPALDRKGNARSGVKLSDQRGCFVAVKGIKVCKYNEIFSRMPRFEILGEGDSYTSFTMIINGDFDLVTNRNSLSKRAFDLLMDAQFIAQVEIFLSDVARSEKVFRELVLRLKRESNESRLNDQIEILNKTKERIRQRERIYIPNADGRDELFLSPLAGEEYLVGVLYACLGSLVPNQSEYKSYWKKYSHFLHKV